MVVDRGAGLHASGCLGNPGPALCCELALAQLYKSRTMPTSDPRMSPSVQGGCMFKHWHRTKKAPKTWALNLLHLWETRDEQAWKGPVAAKGVISHLQSPPATEAKTSGKGKHSSKALSLLPSPLGLPHLPESAWTQQSEPQS